MNRQSFFRTLLLVALITCSILHVEGQTYLTSLEQVETGYYRIYSQYNTNGSDMALSEENTSNHYMYCTAPVASDYSQMWYIKVTASSATSKEITLQNCFSNLNVNRSSNRYHTHERAMTFTLTYDTNGFVMMNGGMGPGHREDHSIWSMNSSVNAVHWQFAVALDNPYNVINTNLSKYFVDESCSEIKDDYKTYSDDALTSVMASDNLSASIINMAIKVKNDAWEVFQDGWKYDESSFRIGKFKPMGSPGRWKNITKVGYALSPNSDPTGIAVKANDELTIYVSDVPIGTTVALRNVPKYNATGTAYTLKKGYNVLTVGADGLLFMDYEVDNTTGGAAPFTAMSSYPEITVHIEGGKVNGYFSVVRGDTNEDWAIMKEKLFKENDFLQLRSNKQIFHMNASSVITACPEKMVELLGQWDFIVSTEHNIMGLSEFDGYFNNPLMAVSFSPKSSSHMYASNYGTYYNETTLSGIMSYENLFAGSELWGPAHEIGHINQAAINMIGQSEVSNNVFSNIVTFLNGHLTSRAEYTYVTLNNMADDVFWVSRGIWERTHMYYQLYQFFHVQGFKTDFYPELFKALRADPMRRVQNTAVDASDDYLKFYKKACEVSGYDLTEFFQAYGFFVIPELKDYAEHSVSNVFWVGDYGTYYLNITQEMIDAAISEVKSHNYKKTNMVFIEDRVTAPLATYEGHAENELKKSYLGYEIGKAGDVGQYTDFVSTNVATGYLASYVENDGGLNVSVNHSNASGAVGFKVYDAAGKLVFLSNKYNFTVPANVYSKIKNTDFTIVAAGGNGEDAIMPAAVHYVEWIVKNKAGEVVKTYHEPQFVNSVVSACPDVIKPAFVSFPSFTAFTYTEPVQKVVEAVYTTPFVESSENAYNYYEVKVRYGWLNETSEGKAAITTSKQNTDYYRWAFFGSPYVGYRIQNKATGKWLNAGESAPEMGDDADAATVWDILPWSENETSFIMKFTTTSGKPYINDLGGWGNNLGYWNNASQIDVTLVPTASTLVPITVDEQEGYWGTFYSSSNVAMPTGVSAYRVTDVDDGTQKLTLTAVEGSVLKGGEGYIVYSTSHEPGIVMESTSAAPASFVGTNYLKGSDSEQEFAGEGSYYILSRKEVTEGVYNYGFFWQNGTGGNSVTNAAHKAFLLVPSSAPAKSYDLSFNATNISNVENSEDDVNGSRYTLSGQRVGKNYKGIIIVKGKKQIQR